MSDKCVSHSYTAAELADEVERLVIVHAWSKLNALLPNIREAITRHAGPSVPVEIVLCWNGLVMGEKALDDMDEELIPELYLGIYHAPKGRDALEFARKYLRRGATPRPD